MYTFQSNIYDDVVISPGTALELVDFFDHPGKKSLTLHDHSALTYVVIGTGADISLDIHTLGSHATCTIFALFLSRNDTPTNAQLTVSLDHSSTAAAIQIVSFLYDGAHADIDGSLCIGSGLHDIQGQLFEHTIVLGDTVSFRTLPKLSVASHEVAASHGATVDTLDPAKLFYMMSKGLSQQTSKTLLVDGYIHSALEHIQHFSDHDIHDIMLRLGL